MDELLQKLLEADVLSADTKSELEQAFKSQLDEAIEVARAGAAADVRAELTEQWVAEKDTLIEAVDTKVGEFLEEEIKELKTDIERFRDLEAEYGQKIVEAKQEMANELKTDLADLVEKIDAFLEMRLQSEMEELKEDIDRVRENDFGRRIFEAFNSEYAANYSDEDSAKISLRETEKRLEQTMKLLGESETKVARMERVKKMNSILSPLSGRQREVMEAILKNVDTDNLDEGYKTFIGRVLRETEENTSEKETAVLAENDTSADDNNPGNKGIVKTGDAPIVESVSEVKVQSTANGEWLKRIAGIS